MPAGTRRTHNKTRLGCAQCKRRRIKCDCTHPICDNCKKKGHECSFLLLAPSSRLSITSPTEPSITSPSASPISATSTSDEIIHSPSNEVALIPRRSSGSQITRRQPASSPSRVLGPKPFITLPEFELPQAFNSISPYLRCNDVWKDARETLSPALQGLLYHYEYTTSLTLAADDPAKSAWQSFIPELASRHRFLIHHILAVASLHLGRLHGYGPERWTMMNVAAAQMNKGLARFRPELENVNAENAAALFASSTLTAVYFFRTSTLDIDELRASVPTGTIVPSSDIVDKMFNCVLRVVFGLRGPLAVLIPGWSHILGGRLQHIANRDWWPPDRLPATERAVEEDKRLAEIENLWKDQHHRPASDIECLSSALLFLRESFGLVSQLTLAQSEYPSTTAICYSVDDVTVGNLKDRGAIFFWATRISRDFITLLEEKNREALVILAHYAILPGRVRNAWWLEGLGANMITAVAMALGRENWHLIEWPVQVVGVDLENAFTARPDRIEGQPGEVPMEII
ncbi:hypothetical protein K458DRAFT_412602 [Lentithecium fluviatile CBS 122367]|uniref:Zn(2)-C6 fungal-type domain-containing protein n=1 Tax=Lentithecium fluviatile CBS 122367 TaxID=1168545 RepID=A0A6G1JM46_9PLEO|nr:hypothetical protein K458DRAFT_412602 [Lentithecium fluviatile CBS 122367]